MSFVCPTFALRLLRLGYIWGTFPHLKLGQKATFGVHFGYIWGVLLSPHTPLERKHPPLGRGALP